MMSYFGSKGVFDRLTMTQALLLCIAFAVSVTLPPLYLGHYYLIFGLAREGFGFLAHDWIANTIDPFPIFSTIVSLTYRLADPILFYGYTTILLGIYLMSLCGIVHSLFPSVSENRGRWLLTIAVIFALHTALFGKLTLGWGGVLHRGVANYYLMSPVFQPSLFGVFLILSLALFCAKRPIAATVLAMLVTCIHPSYILASALMILGFAAVSWVRDHDKRTTIICCALGAFLIIPLLYTKLILLPATSPEIMKEAQRILIFDRIPHHAVPAKWIGTALIRLPYIALALWLIRKHKVAIPLWILFIGMILLSAAQMLTGSFTLALAAPWRLTAFLIPISSGIFIGFGISKFTKKLKDSFAKVIALVLIIISTGFGAYSMINPKHIYAFTPYQELITHLRAHATSDDLYLVPPRNKEFSHIRLSAGIPIFVNFRLHPFRDEDILKWKERIDLANTFYASADDACATLSDIQNETDITHVIVINNESTWQINCQNLTETYRNEHYAMYTVTR